MQSHIAENDPRTDFLAVEKYCRGLGLDWGPGTNKFAETVLCTDWYPHKGVNLVWNIAPEGGEKTPFPFSDESFDFVFASHIIEDFPPVDLQFVFDEMLRLIKPNGYFVIIIPDMENKRYPDWDEVFTEEDEEVKSGKRIVGHLKGNPSHRTTAGLSMCYNLIAGSKFLLNVVQKDTIPHSSMSLDFVIKKIGLR
jgi:SAM-dependent methyltransferase